MIQFRAMVPLVPAYCLAPAVHLSALQAKRRCYLALGTRIHYLIDKTLRKTEAICTTQCMGTDREALKLSTSTVNPSVLSILIATLLQHRTDLNQKEHP